jgi:hypothetical protein
MWDFLPWMKPEKVEELVNYCSCGNGKVGLECHDLEHERSQHEKPEPD